jgi:hypothetical protein
VLRKTAVFSPHPVVRRDARRAPFVLLARFFVVAACAAVLGFAISQVS